MRKTMFAGLSAVALILGGCGQKSESPSAAASENAAASPENAPGITVTDASVRLPAVSGSPGVAYLTVSQSGGAARNIAGVYIEGVERAEMHETATQNGVSSMRPVKFVVIESGKSAVFKPGGLHVMLFGVADTLKAGGMTEVTITLDNGDKVSAPAKVESIGGGMRGHGSSAMDHDMSNM